MEFIFRMQINIKTSTSWHYVFDGSSQACQRTQNRTLEKYLKYIKNKVTAFVFYCDAKQSDTLWGSCHVHVFERLWSKMGVAF